MDVAEGVGPHDAPVDASRSLCTGQEGLQGKSPRQCQEAAQGPLAVAESGESDDLSDSVEGMEAHDVLVEDECPQKEDNDGEVDSPEHGSPENRLVRQVNPDVVQPNPSEEEVDGKTPRSARSGESYRGPAWLDQRQLDEAGEGADDTTATGEEDLTEDPYFDASKPWLDDGIMEEVLETLFSSTDQSASSSDDSSSVSSSSSSSLSSENDSEKEDAGSDLFLDPTHRAVEPRLMSVKEMLPKKDLPDSSTNARAMRFQREVEKSRDDWKAWKATTMEFDKIKKANASGSDSEDGAGLAVVPKTARPTAVVKGRVTAADPREDRKAKQAPSKSQRKTSYERPWTAPAKRGKGIPKRDVHTELPPHRPNAQFHPPEEIAREDDELFELREQVNEITKLLQETEFDGEDEEDREFFQHLLKKYARKVAELEEKQQSLRRLRFTARRQGVPLFQHTAVKKLKGEVNHYLLEKEAAERRRQRAAEKAAKKAAKKKKKLKNLNSATSADKAFLARQLNREIRKKEKEEQMLRNAMIVQENRRREEAMMKAAKKKIKRKGGEEVEMFTRVKKVDAVNTTSADPFSLSKKAKKKKSVAASKLGDEFNAFVGQLAINRKFRAQEVPPAIRDATIAHKEAKHRRRVRKNHLVVHSETELEDEKTAKKQDAAARKLLRLRRKSGDAYEQLRREKILRRAKLLAKQAALPARLRNMGEREEEMEKIKKKILKEAERDHTFAPSISNTSKLLAERRRAREEKDNSKVGAQRLYLQKRRTSMTGGPGSSDEEGTAHRSGGVDRTKKNSEDSAARWTRWRTLQMFFKQLAIDTTLPVEERSALKWEAEKAESNLFDLDPTYKACASLQGLITEEAVRKRISVLCTRASRFPRPGNNSEAHKVVPGRSTAEFPRQKWELVKGLRDIVVALDDTMNAIPLFGSLDQAEKNRLRLLAGEGFKTLVGGWKKVTTRTKEDWWKVLQAVKEPLPSAVPPVPPADGAEGSGSTGSLTAKEHEQLHSAVINEKPTILHYLLEHGANIDFVADPESASPEWIRGLTALHVACKLGKESFVRTLIDAKADVNSQSDQSGDGCTPLSLAALSKNLTIVQMLCEAGADVNKESLNLLDIPLHRSGTLEILTYLLDRGSDVNKRDSQGRTPLHWACWQGNTKIIRELLDRGASVGVSSFQGETALHLASLKGRPKVLKVLLQHPTAKSVIDVMDDSFVTPLHICAEFSHIECMQLLLSEGANPNISGESGKAAIHCSAEVGDHDGVELLLTHKADVNVTDRRRHSAPLHIACDNLDLDMVYRLTKWSADTNKEDARGQTALHRTILAYRTRRKTLAKEKAAAEKPQSSDSDSDSDSDDSSEGYGVILDTIQRLVSHDADINAPDEDGNTPLHIACSVYDLETIKELVENGAQHLRNRSGLYPVDLIPQLLNRTKLRHATLKAHHELLFAGMQEILQLGHDVSRSPLSEAEQQALTWEIGRLKEQFLSTHPLPESKNKGGTVHTSWRQLDLQSVWDNLSDSYQLSSAGAKWDVWEMLTRSSEVLDRGVTDGGAQLTEDDLEDIELLKEEVKDLTFSLFRLHSQDNDDTSLSKHGLWDRVQKFKTQSQPRSP